MEKSIKTKKSIKKLVHGWEQSLQIREQLNNERLKQSYVDSLIFSAKLNNFLLDWINENGDHFVFVDEDDFDPNDIEGALQKHIKRYKETGKIHIWKGGSDNNIFASTQINWYFRAWHDSIHIINEIGYDFIGESEVCFIQMSQLPKEWVWERQLIQSEVIGQALHFMKYNSFVTDQRRFTLNFIETGLINKH